MTMDFRRPDCDPDPDSNSDRRLHLLPFVRASHLAPDEKEGPVWLIDGLWMKGGVGILGGAPKSAKSWLALEISVSVASGTPCLGRFRVERPGTVLLYAAEDSPAIVRSRLEGIAAHHEVPLEGLPIEAITAESIRLDLGSDQTRLKNTVAAVRPSLLVLDPFVRIQRIDENSAGEVASVLAYLRSLQRALDVAVLVVHHARKNGAPSSSPGHALRGSTDFHAWGDATLYMQRRGDGRRGAETILLTIEHRCAPAPEPIALRLDDRDQKAVHLAIAGGGAADSHASPVRPAAMAPADVESAVLAAVAATHPIALTRAALRARLRLRNQRLGEILTALEAAGRIVRAADGWRLAEGESNGSGTESS